MPTPLIPAAIGRSPTQDLAGWSAQFCPETETAGEQDVERTSIHLEEQLPNQGGLADASLSMQQESRG